MIVLTRLNGARYAINDEQIERLEDGPNTVVVLVNGNRYTALESLDEVIDAIVAFRARVLDAVSVGEENIDRRESSVTLFRPHSVLAPVEPVRDVDDSDDDSPIPRPRSTFGTFRPTRRNKGKS